MHKAVRYLKPCQHCMVSRSRNTAVINSQAIIDPAMDDFCVITRAEEAKSIWSKRYVHLIQRIFNDKDYRSIERAKRSFKAFSKHPSCFDRRSCCESTRINTCAVRQVRYFIIVKHSLVSKSQWEYWRYCRFLSDTATQRCS